LQAPAQPAGVAVGASIKDVARLARVSVATVSRALNGHANVADAVRRRVTEAANELRYIPHHAARSLSSRRTHTIGVVLPDLHGEFFSELIRGIDQVAREHHLHLLLSSYHGDADEQAAALAAMRGRVDGVLVMSPHADRSAALSEHLGDLPAVLLDTRDAGQAHAALAVDHYAGACAIMRHLLDAGHRRIAFIGGPQNNLDAEERLRGYLDTLETVKPRPRPWVLPGDFSEAAGHAAGVALLASAERPDAVFAANDMMALGCLFALNQGGLVVPRDVALAGFDDIPLARFVVPALTTARVNIADLGARALRALVESAPADHRETITPELIVRESSARPPPTRTPRRR
jgi:LacI family transcriptional regulator